MICFAPSLSDSITFLTLTRLVVVIKFVNFRFALFTPPLGDFQVLASLLPLLGSGLFLVPNVVKVGDKNSFFLFSLCLFACYGIVLCSTSDLSLFQYNDAQFSCAFEKKNDTSIKTTFKTISRGYLGDFQ
jgi:hypothetical protein